MDERPWSDSSRAAPTSPTELRETIPALEEQTYFNWGASGPSPRYVVDAAANAQEYHEFDAPGDEGMYPVASEMIEATRRDVADLIGASDESIALTNSTTDGINRVGTALDWETGDVIVTTDLEHAAGRLPWTRLERSHGVEVRVIETTGGQIDLDALATKTRGADLLCVSAVDWLYGRVQPVADIVEIAHENGALALVDAVQAPGQTPVDVGSWKADFVAGAGHKWLLGLWGAGFLYIDEAALETTEPIHVGYRSVRTADGGEYELHDDARRFEIGTTSPTPYVGLQAAIHLRKEVGETAIQDRFAHLRAHFVDQIPVDRLLSSPEEPTGLVTIRVANPESVVKALASESISVRSLPLPEAVRVSIHAVNTEAEIDDLVSALSEVWE